MLYFDFINPYIIYVLVVFITLFLIYSIFQKQDFIRKHKTSIVWIVAILLTWTQVARYMGLLFEEEIVFEIGVFHFRILESNLTTMLPFYMCRISAFVLMIYAYSKSKYLHSFLFYWGALGIAGVIYPNGPISNIGNLTETFYIDHILLTIVPFYLVVYEDYHPSLKDMLLIGTLMFFILLAFIPINHWIGADYFYLQDQSIFAILFGHQSSILFAAVHTIMAMGFFSIYYFYFRSKEFTRL
jgi:uncharacterized membrane protein YwaF